MARTAVTSAGNEGRWVQAGAACWMACAQYFLAEVLVSHFTATTYSPLRNVISDLGSTVCDAQLCSPLHGWMNASFCLQGVLIALGAVLLWQALGRSRLWRFAMALLAISGLGVIAVGLAPENVAPAAHVLGAAAHFLAGGAGMLIAGIAAVCDRTAKGRRMFAAISITCGICTLANTALLGAHAATVDVGAIERAAAYPYTLWLVGSGVYLLRNREDRNL